MLWCLGAIFRARSRLQRLRDESFNTLSLVDSRSSLALRIVVDDKFSPADWARGALRDFGALLTRRACLWLRNRSDEWSIGSAYVTRTRVTGLLLRTFHFLSGFLRPLLAILPPLLRRFERRIYSFVRKASHSA